MTWTSAEEMVVAFRRPRAIRTTTVDVVPHWAAFSREPRLIGRELVEDMPVVCERFELVFA